MANGEDIRGELERLHPDSYGWALCCSGRDPTIAETVLQTAYLKILEGKARFGGRSSFRTWLFAVIRNTAADERRSRALAFWRFLPDPLFGGLADPTEHPEKRLLGSEIQAAFQIALGTLPRRQREVLHLVFYQELTLSEVAVVLGLSVGSVRQHYERGKHNLRDSEAMKVFRG